MDHLAIPAACFTHPEIAMVGLTEEQAKDKVSWELVHAFVLSVYDAFLWWPLLYRVRFLVRSVFFIQGFSCEQPKI